MKQSKCKCKGFYKPIDCPVHGKHAENKKLERTIVILQKAASELSCGCIRGELLSQEEIDRRLESEEEGS